MESSEDDAGNATIASRRASAREKDIGLAEDFEPTRDTQHEPPEDSASCKTPAMSEDNFDGDSVPSPSSQDVNTSTEAILDMIDEFVDGPGAPKRLPRVGITVKSPAVKEALESLSKTEPKQQTDDLEQPRTPSPAPIDQSEIINESTPIKSEEHTPHIKDSMCANTSSNLSSPQTSSVSVNITESSNQLTECSSAVVNAEPESLAIQSVSDSPSSSIQSVKNILDTNECEQSEQLKRTVKCVTSSDNRDNVTVERAESTSSECSVSESKGFLVEPLIRSPLKRRLVRPVPSDRRPDSTVSSTVDSRPPNVCTTQPTSCDVVVKDVSSSSDAVSLLHGKVKLEEISNVSEISICKAETSTAPKKIRLVRPKVISVLSNSIKTPEALSPEKIQCQSTSPADDQASTLFPVVPTTSRVDTPKSQECKVISAPVKCVIDNFTTQAPETVSCVKISETKENVISSNENLSPSLNTISPSESSTTPSKDLKSSDADEAPSEVQSILEPSKVKSKVESTEVLPNIFEPKGSTVPSNIQAIITPTEPLQIQSKEIEPIERTKTSHDSESSKSVRKTTIQEPTEIHLNKPEQCRVQSKVLEASHEIVTQSKQSTSTESNSEKLKPAQIQFKELEEPTESLSKIELKPIESQSKVTVVKVEDKVVTEIPSKVLEQIELQSHVVESNESQSKVTELTGNQSKTVGPVENPLDILIQTESQPQENAGIQSKVLTPADNQSKVLNPGKSQPNLLKSSDSQPKALFLAEIQTKALESADKVVKVNETKPTEPEATEDQSELLDQTQNQSNQQLKSALSQSKDLNLEIAQLGLTKKELDQSKKTNIDSRISLMEIDTDSTNIKEKESGDVETEILKKQNLEAVVNALDEVRKLPPIKLTLTKVSKAEKKTNDTEVQSSSNNAIVTAHQDKEVLVSNTDVTPNCDNFSQTDDDVSMDQKKVQPIKLNLCSVDRSSSLQSSSQKSNAYEEKPDSTKQVPKLTIKLGNKQAEEIKSPIPKLTIKSIRPPMEQEDSFENSQQMPSITKLNIKPIVKRREENYIPADADLNDQTSRTEKRPSITKLNIKPIAKPAEKINDMHRKSSSSEISESEYSENDETSTSDQASASDQGPSDTVPKVTIKLGKPGTESEGKFYTEQNIPKLTIKGLQQNENDEKDVKLKLVISQTEDITMEKVPKLTIKTVTKSEGQPLSPKLTIKPIRPPENVNEIPKLKITTDSFGTSSEIKENMHVPKITIKAVTKTDLDTNTKTPKKSTSMCDNPEHIPVVTKLNIKPIIKPIESGESSEELVDKVPVVSKLNIKPIVKPKDNEVDSSVEDVPKIIKLNIKPLKNPEESSSEGKDCDENIVDMESIPVVTKLNIKPIVKPEEDERLKDSENQSSETGTSSDDNTDHIPVVMKLNIKPIVKPSEMEEVKKSMPNDQNIPVVTKLNIKPLVKPEDNSLPHSPKRESLRSPGSSSIPSVAKLNIKPIVKHEETSENKIHDEYLDKTIKNPPLVMKINMKNVCDNITDQKYNSYVDGTKSPRREITKPMSPKIKKSSLTPDRDNLKSISAANVEQRKNTDFSPDSPNLISTVAHSSMTTHRNCLPEKNDFTCSKETKPLSIETKQVPDKLSSNKSVFQINEMHERKTDLVAPPISPGSAKQKKSLQNCTLLKQLLSNTKDDSEKYREMSISNYLTHSEKTDAPLTNCNATTNVKTLVDEIRKHNSDLAAGLGRRSPILEVPNDLSFPSKSLKTRSIQDVRKDVNESVTKPLEIVTDKIPNQSSGQDSPRIILKINKTDHGPSSKIITEECHKPKDSPPQNHTENTHQTAQEKQSPKKYVNSRKKLSTDEAVSLTIGKRLRSSRVVETPEKPAITIRRNTGKRPVSETSPTTTTTTNKESEISVLDSKRFKLEQLLSVNKGLTITPVASNFTQTLQSKPHTEIKQGEKRNHSLLNSDNSKNGNSKLHNILSNLQAKQMQSLQLSEAAILNKDTIVIPDAESNTSTGSSDVVVEISRVENSHPDVQEMIINENSEFRDISTPEEVSQDPLEVDVSKTPVELVNEPPSIKAVEVTPTPRKRGRPRKIPLSEGAKPAKPPTPPALPVSALEERPQRSLRLMRERPAILAKPRGRRGRGRGGRRMASPVAASSPETDESTETVIVIETLDEDEPQRRSSPVRPSTPEDPTSSRIKLPRMTEALDKSSACMTPLSSRRRSSTDMKLFGEPAVVIESPVKIEEFMKSPEKKATRGRGSRGGRGTPRGRTPRGRGRGRGGGKGATYMKETMGIYGRVCGPATTTVELFEEETCMMDDNATPKPSHLLDEDSQSSVKSSTNDSSNKMKRSKFADLFDSNKVWTASDVKEYTWPPHDVPNVDHQVMMIQEQVAMFLGVKSFKRRYSELKRRAVVGEEKDYCLSRGIVTEALCDLGITAVDASDVLDVMLSDYPHKYEEYRSYQRQKQLTESLEEADAKFDDKAVKIEVKSEKTSDKPEPPKVDPEKTRQDMAAAAIASAAEWNAMANAWRHVACADLQSNTIHRRRPPPTSAPTHCRPPHGFYPHAVLPGQYQHSYTRYTPDQLRYFPLNTVIAAPPAPPSPVESSSESEGSWGDSSSSTDNSQGPHHSAKRKKLTKVKRSSQQDKEKDESRGSTAPEEVVDLCRVCKLRLEANRKYTHERFLVCADCNAKLHPGCLELGADTIRKCREYAWQCGACKRCGACSQPPRHDSMLHCDLCDRAFHKPCLGLDNLPTGRWHCVECAICKSCGARDPGGLAGALGTPGTSGTSGPSGTPGPSSTPGPSGTPGPAGPAEWHHQTRRGPGGHKVYSHSLCTPCARAYRIGRYCPLCERSFIGPKGTMQLVICKLCDRQLHQECVRATVSSLNVLDYRCAECRRSGITSRAGAVRAAPRTIATLFMAKRRFNKYAHKQYMQSRQQGRTPSDPEVSDPLDATDSSRTDFGD